MYNRQGNKCRGKYSTSWTSSDRFYLNFSLFFWKYRFYQTELYYMLCYIEIKAFIIIRQFGICVFLMDFW